MTPILISATEQCYCGKNDWVRGGGQGGLTVIWCDVCGYTVDIPEAGKILTEGER